MGWEGEGAEGERKKLKTINRSFLNIKFYLFVYCIFRNENQKKCLKKKICRKIRNTIFASLSLPLYNLIKLLNEANFFHLYLWFSSTCRFKAFSVHFPIFTIHRGLNPCASFSPSTTHLAVSLCLSVCITWYLCPNLRRNSQKIQTVEMENR